MLMRKTKDGEWVQWRGEQLGDTQYPLNIGDLPQSTDEALKKVGLYRVARAPVPDDQIAVRWTVTETKGGPVSIPTLEKKPEPIPTLEDRVAVLEKKLGL